jgi:hypothetical protein
MLLAALEALVTTAVLVVNLIVLLAAVAVAVEWEQQVLLVKMPKGNQVATELLVLVEME